MKWYLLWSEAIKTVIAIVASERFESYSALFVIMSIWYIGLRRFKG